MTSPTAIATESAAHIRSHFPALDRVCEGRSVAYFDGPGGTQVPRVVAEAMTDYLFHHNANTHWAFPTSQETDAILQDGRQALADFLNGHPDEIVFGPNMTTLTFHLSRALGRLIKPDDAILTTELDHHANVDPWRWVAKERGAAVRSVALNPKTGQLDQEELERRLKVDRPRVLAIGAASNALGTINEIARITALAKSVGAIVFVDAVHYAPHVLTDVQAFGCDFLVCSAYKFYGPHLGVLWGRREWLEALDAPKLQPAPDQAPDRWETGTQNHEGIAGAAAAVNFLASLARDVEGPTPTRRDRLRTVFRDLHERGQRLIETLWRGLASLPGVRLYGPDPSQSRTPTLSFTIDGHSAESIAKRLADRGLFVSHGNFYALTVAERLVVKEQGMVRVGCACYTDPEEIDRLLDAVRDIGGG